MPQPAIIPLYLDCLTSVTIGANVSLKIIATERYYDEFIYSGHPIGNGFENFYSYSNGKKAGTYTYNDGQWAYR
ncbi:MAG: hypothetical protein LBP76_04245 [Treponema sp.]|nr:hypothetical protein [Treponema sp.]